MTKPIYEIRDYTIESEWFGAYKEWAKDIAAPWLKENLEVIDFWMDGGEPPEVSGSNPVDANFFISLRTFFAASP